MAVHTTRAQTNQPHVAAPSAPSQAAPERRSCTALAARAARGCARRPTPSRLEGIRAAASVMGWLLWILLALTIGALLTLAPLML